MSDSHEPEHFHVRLEGPRVVRLTVAEMTPEDLRLAVAFAERELQLMQQQHIRHKPLAIEVRHLRVGRGIGRVMAERRPCGQKTAPLLA